MHLIEEALSQEPFDVVHVEHLRAALYGLGAMNFISAGGAYRGVPPTVVWDSVDCISALLREACHRASSRLKRRIFAFEQPRTESLEGKLLRRFDQVIVTTERDARSLTSLAAQTGCTAACPPEVICNGVDLEQPTSATIERQPATVVMTGKMSYHANVAAARHLLEDIMPIVWRSRPDVRVEIVGKEPSSIVLALARSSTNAERVAVTGEVQDIRPYLRRATLAIAPIVYGVGVQNKVLEAMAASAPVVATPLATSALSLKNGCEVLTGHCPEEMALHILRLIENPELRAQLGCNGRRYVASHHNWDHAVSQLEAVYRKRRMPQTLASHCVAPVEA
jgi:glycosyltransferase involved in cell wall biosynthesis